MDNVPVHANHGSTSGRREEPTSPSKHKMRGGRGRKKVVLLSIGVIIVAALVVLAVLGFYRSSTASAIDTGKYQAVFLQNGQVYFGKLQILNGNYMQLTDVWYLETKTNTDLQKTATESSTDVQLVQLGGEIHGPTDKMVINKDQVLFFENLKPDGKVTQSITAYQAKNK